MTPARCLAVLALGWGCAPGERPVEPGDTKPGPPGCSDASDLGQVTLDGTRGFGDLQAALDAAEPGSELLLCPGYYLGDFIAEVPVRVAALEDRETTWLAGTGGEAPVLALPGGSEIVGLTVRGGSGGVLMTSQGTLRIEASRITGNFAERGAGLVVAQGSVAALVGTELTDNIAWVGGGGAWVQPGGTLELDETSVVSDNWAGQYGAGVWLHEAHLIGGFVSGNRIVSSGRPLPTVDHEGALLFEGEAFGGAGVALSGTGSVTGTEIAWNAGAGGSLSVTGGTATLEDVWVHHNDASPHAGGGLGVANAHVVGEGSTRFEHNLAYGGAGGLVVRGSVRGVTFADNMSGDDVEPREAGGLLLEFGELESVELVGNRASSGAGLSCRGTLRLVDVTIEANRGQGRGGGMMLTPGGVSTVEIVNSSIRGNEAVSGGGIYAMGAVKPPMILTLTNTSIAENTAGRGGGLYLMSHAVTSGGEISGNTADEGGGAYIDFGGALITTSTDLGIDDADNTPDDARPAFGGSYAGYGAAASLHCDAFGCSPHP